MTTSTHDLTVGEPQVAGPLAVFPVFGPAPRLDYRSFAQAQGHGAFIKELEGGASVNDLTLANTSALPILAYEGEEVLGAQQDRTFDVSVLVASGEVVHVPVSCVEAGRWDGSRYDEEFTVSPQAADPSLRARKRAVANRRSLAGAEARADQTEVWSHVQSRISEHAVASPSSKMGDVYDQRRDQLFELTRSIEHLDGQVGAVVLVGGAPVALDFTSRPDVFASLLPRLAQGYALDALSVADGVDADAFEAERFLDDALHANRAAVPTPGMGQGIRVSSAALIGGGIEHEGELVQLCAFPSEPAGADQAERHVARPIVRPSRRRPQA